MKGLTTMPSAKIILSYDSEKLAALRQFSEKGAPDIETVLTGQIEKIYTKTVPPPVRQYIEARAKPLPPKASKENPKATSKPNTGT
jgi:hypothetical protein